MAGVRRPKNVMAMRKVFDKLMTYAKENDQENFVSESFNAMLDTMRDDDFFGTEGQSDPRGDNRD
jgi:hypothetical protein